MRRRRGSIALEFAVSFAALWAILSGVVEFGYSFWAYNTLENAVNGGAMLAARLPFEAPGTGFAGQVKRMVVFGSPSGDGVPIAPALTLSNVSVTWQQDSIGVPQTITVGIMGYRIRSLFRTYTLADRPRVTVRYMGRYVVPPT